MPELQETCVKRKKSNDYSNTRISGALPRWTSLVAQMVKASSYNAGGPGSIPGSGRYPGEGNGNLLQYSCMVDPMDSGAWKATVHGVANSWT